MVHEYGEKLFSQLSEGLQLIDEQEPPMVVFRAQSRLVTGALRELEAYRLAHPFEELSAEVFYFKELLPRFCSLQLYFRYVYKLRVDLPVGDKKRQRKYYQAALARIAAFFSGNGFHYDYHSSGLTQLDGLFFTSSGDPQDVLQPVLADPFGQGTLMGRLVARFMALERFRNDLLCRLHGLEVGPVLSHREVDNTGKLVSGLRWTGEVIHLIELAHGMHLTGQVNAGEMGIVEFFRQLGEVFKVNLRIPKRGFDDLKSRKTMSRTYFLDKMREELIRKMDEEDAYDPDKALRRKGFFR
ncbi:RteC domain-containing protein [Pedobacter panaciterrae]|uniref:RteC domain-containing protein n=1 Tax=Pedobacter panaciterrae TaxID=363849 RepID=A0ABU8NKB5_9SPHI